MSVPGDLSEIRLDKRLQYRVSPVLLTGVGVLDAVVFVGIVVFVGYVWSPFPNTEMVSAIACIPTLSLIG
jgi:hypothetical protein